jgi:hypothetical protein
MTTTKPALWRILEKRSSKLFFLAGVIFLLTATYRGSAYLVDAVSFNLSIANFMLFGRLAVLLALGGFTVQIADRSPRLARWGRGFVSLAATFTIGLFTLAVLAGLGITTPLIAVFGLGTFVLSFITYSLFGIGIVRTGPYPTRIGGLLLIAAVGLLAVFVGQMFLPTGLIGSVVEGGLSLVYFAMWHLLRSEVAISESMDPAMESTP